MSVSQSQTVQVPYTPCPPEEFAGRHTEQQTLIEALEQARTNGQAIMVSGARGSGKSSFIDWAEYKIQNGPDRPKSPAIKRPFFEAPGMVFKTYQDILTELKGHKKFGWFRKIVSDAKVQKSLDGALNVFEKVLSLSGPYKVPGEIGIHAARTLLPGQPVQYTDLLLSFLAVLRSISGELTEKNQLLAIICDDVQWSSEADFQLLKDLIRNLPGGIALIIAFRREQKNIPMHDSLVQELTRLHYQEIDLGGMSSEEVSELAEQRFDVQIDDKTADMLCRRVGDPLCLVTCFNVLNRRGLEPTSRNIRKILDEVVEPARMIYSDLDPDWKNRVSSLSILRPPLPLNLIACMVGADKNNLVKLKDELGQSICFKRLEKELYDYSHPSLREYCREELPKSMKTTLHQKAAVCLERFKEGLSEPEPSINFSLAEHYYEGEEWEQAAELNLQLGYWLYDHFSYGLALELTTRAEVSAGKLKNKDQYAHALHQKGMILQAIFRHSDALIAYKQCLEITREIDNRDGEGNTLHQIGMVYQDTNKYPEALEHYGQSLKLKRELGDRAGEATTLHQIGRVYQDTNKYPEALEHYGQSLELKRELGNRAGEATTLHQIGMVYQDTNKYPEALEHYGQSLELERELGNRAGEAMTLHQIGMVYQLTNKYPEALEHYWQSLELERELGNRAGEAQTLHQIGRVYEETNRFEETLDHYHQSLEIAREVGDRAGEEIILRSIERVSGQPGSPGG